MEDALPRVRLTLCIVVLLFLSAAPCRAADLVDKVVAVVNGKLITLFDVNERTKDILRRTQGVDYRPDDPRYADLRRQVLDSMINDILIEQEAARFKVNVSETEIDNEVNELRKKNDLTEQQLKQELAKEGLTLPQFRDKLKQDALKKRLLGYMVHRKVLITDDEIKDYYEKNKAELSAGKSVLGPKVAGNIGFIMIPTKKQAEQVRTEIASGKISFAEAAKRYSVGPGRDQGGNLGDVQVKDLAPPLREALQAVPAGQVTQPVMLDGKAVLLKLRDGGDAASKPAAAPAGATPAYDSVKEQIQDLLYKQKFDKLFQEYIDNLRSKAVVEVRL